MNGRDKRIELFETAPVLQAVMKMAVPTVLGSLVMVLYNLADTYFVGLLNDPIQNSAVTFSASVLLAFNAVNNLFGVGTSSLMSRAMGEKRYEYVKRTSTFGFWCAVVCGVLFSVFCFAFQKPLFSLLGATEENLSATREYMTFTVFFGATPSILNVVFAYLVRAEGHSLNASLGTMSGCILNMILDPFFILPQFLGMGAAGAGLATMLSNIFACLYFFTFLFVKRKNTFVCIDPRKLKWDKNIAGSICSVGIPASIQNLLNVVSMALLNNLAASFGSTAVAAMGISYKLYIIPMSVALGFSQGSMPLVGYNYASGNTARMKKVILTQETAVTSFIVIVTLLYYVFSGGLVRLFMENVQVVSYGTAFLRGMSIGIPFICLDFLGLGVFQACGKGMRALFFAIARKVIFEIPLLIMLNHVFPLYGLAYAQSIAEIFMAGIVTTTLIIFVKRVLNKSNSAAQKMMQEI